MAVSTEASGTSSSLTLDTPTTLATTTNAGVYVCMWNLTTSAKGDLFRCYIDTKVLTGDTAETIWQGWFGEDMTSNCIVTSPPVCSMFSLASKIEQTDGTGRAIPYSILKLGTPTTSDSGTWSLTVDVVSSGTTKTAANVYVAMFNLTNLADDDVIELYVTSKVLTGDTEETVWRGTFAQSQGAIPIVQSPPIVSMHSITQKALQTDGTGRSVPYSLLTLQ